MLVTGVLLLLFLPAVYCCSVCLLIAAPLHVTPASFFPVCKTASYFATVTSSVTAVAFRHLFPPYHCLHVTPANFSLHIIVASAFTAAACLFL
jgi:hypothetical protein